MHPEERAPAPSRALTPVAPAAAGPVEEARARLAAALAEVTALDAEVEGLSARLADFAGALERRLGPPDAQARDAAALVRRLQSLADALLREAARLREAGAARRTGGRRPATGQRGGAARRAGEAWSAHRWEHDEEDEDGAEGGAEGGAERRGPGPGDGDEVPTLERQAAALKRLHRRLARLLHPDLAPDGDERERLSGLMARANAAYRAGDLEALELMAGRLGAGEPVGALGEAERLAHLERRIEQLGRVAASLRRERARLAASRTARLAAEAGRRAAAGGDYFTESEEELAAEAEAARQDALHRLDAVARAAAALGGERRRVMGELERKGSGAVRRAFDPLLEGGLVRRSAARLERAHASAAARALARWLEEAAVAAPHEAGLTLLAFFLEAAGDRPPPAVAAAAGLAARWEALRAGWPGAPGLAGALARLPRHLALGARAGREEVVAGLQLAEAGLAAGVRLSLGSEAVAARAREVLAVLGPAERCRRCRRGVLALHLRRTSGLDERHGLACPRCGEVLRSYWRYGEPEGLEALWPLAVECRLAAELPVRLGPATVAFGLLPARLAALTAGGLAALLTELYLAPYGLPLSSKAVRVAGRGGLLAPRAKVQGAGRLAFRLEGGAPAPEELVELLRTRVERRFRPGAAG